MVYRLLEIADLYGECVKQLDLNGLSYNEANRVINEGCFFESDYIHRQFRKQLGLETMLVYYNCGQIQDKWDHEQDKDPFSVLLRQIKSFKPDIILVSCLYSFSREQLQRIREILNNSVILSTYFFSLINEQAKQVLPEYEIVFTGSNFWAKTLSEYNGNVQVVRHAFESSLIEKIPKQEPENKVGFIGSIMIGRDVHTNRIDLLSALYKNHIPFDFYGKIYGSLLTPRSFITHFLHEPARMADRITTTEKLKKTCKPSLFGLPYYSSLAKYAVNLNVHAEIAGTGAGNMRMFEVTGVGSCLVTDYREENALLFEEDREIVIYKSSREMAEKVRYLFDHPEEMKQIAENGQRRTLKDHNYKNKALAMDEHYQKVLKRG